LLVRFLWSGARWLAAEGAALVRVNRIELESLFSPAECKLSGGELLRLARDRYRALRWTATDGSAPVCLSASTVIPKAFPHPRPAGSPTGSGDVMFACILQARFHQGLSWRDAVAWSLPYAAANAAHAGGGVSRSRLEYFVK